MSNAMSPRRRQAVAVLVAVATGAAGVGVAAADALTRGGEGRLARALVAAKQDGLPRSWTISEYNADARGRCLTPSAHNVAARARAGFGDPNSGMWSVATVLRTRADASRFYRTLRVALPGCLRRAVRHNPVDADSVARARPLTFGRHGDRSSAWRLRATYGGNAFVYDWVIVQTRRAVLVDLFVLGADRRGSVAMEQRIVRRALRRATALM